MEGRWGCCGRQSGDGGDGSGCSGGGGGSRSRFGINIFVRWSCALLIHLAPNLQKDGLVGGGALAQTVSVLEGLAEAVGLCPPKHDQPRCVEVLGVRRSTGRVPGVAMGWLGNIAVGR